MVITDSSLCPLMPFAHCSLVAPSKSIPLIGYPTAIACIINYLILELAAARDDAVKTHQERLEQVYRENDILFSMYLNRRRVRTSADDAKDIHQDVFLRVYRGLGKFEFRSEFGTWLHRITTNVCLAHQVRSRRHRHIPLDGQFDGRGDAGNGQQSHQRDEATARRMGEDEEITRRVGTALERLSPRQRLVFTLRHYEGYRLAEIARMLKCSEGSVKKYLFEATGRMRSELSDLLVGT